MDDTTPLAEVREYVRDGAEAGGVHCPACGQFAKVYRRKLNSGMAVALIDMWRRGGKASCDWVRLPDSLATGRGGDPAKLRYWGLIEADDDRNGRWRLTRQGLLFVHQRSILPKHAVVYNGHLLRLDDTDGWTDIRQALGSHFDYAELMAA